MEEEPGATLPNAAERLALWGPRFPTAPGPGRLRSAGRHSIVLCPQDSVSWMPYLSIACVISYVIGHALGPSMYPELLPRLRCPLSCTIGSSSPERPGEAQLPLSLGSGQSILSAKNGKVACVGRNTPPSGTSAESLPGGPGPLSGTTRDVTYCAKLLLLAFSHCFPARPGVLAAVAPLLRHRPRAPCAQQELREGALAASLRPQGKQPCLSLSPGPIPALFITEVFLQSSRSSAFMVGGSVHWLSNFTVGLVFPFIQVSVSAGALESQNPQAVRREPLRESEPGSPSLRWASGLTASSSSP